MLGIRVAENSLVLWLQAPIPPMDDPDEGVAQKRTGKILHTQVALQWKEKAQRLHNWFCIRYLLAILTVQIEHSTEGSHSSILANDSLGLAFHLPPASVPWWLPATCCTTLLLPLLFPHAYQLPLTSQLWRQRLWKLKPILEPYMLQWCSEC